MITKIKTIGVLLLSISLFACKKSEPTSYNGSQYIEFYNTYDIKEITAQYSTFYYLDASKVTDTVWFRVKTVGSIPNKTSYIKFEAFKDPSASPTYPDATAGIQYVSFDDPDVAKLMKMDAGKYEAYIPVVLKRDASLKDKTYQIRFNIVASDDFKPASGYHSEGVVYVSDGLSQPSTWYTTGFFLGTYGKVKHEFIIKQSGQRWDAAFITTVLADANLTTYYKYKFIKELKELNATRVAQGLTELREDPNNPNTAVSFPSL